MKKHVFPGLPHSFTKYQDLPSSRRFNELLAESVRWCLGEEKVDEVGRWTFERAEGEKRESRRVCWRWGSLLGRGPFGRWRV